ncbi:uncharacterized protein LOC111829660 [Capsella rubella]|uniref:uncharacterized protein LOC111829660 n=1 Tax=Capsella rubella TaxID=81985 RepID=UPI000CD59AF8|nr:uncharacterized protein LOC111829660 [Capsella rubella]
MFTIEDAVGQMVAWPAKKVINLETGQEARDNTHEQSLDYNMNKCKLLDLSTNCVIVAEGRWESKEPKALVNGIPIGSKGVKVFLDVVHFPETFVWKPTMEKSHLEDCLNSFVAWPINKIVFEDAIDATGQKTLFCNSASTTEQISIRKSATTDKQSTAKGSKSRDATSPATCSRNSTVAAFSKTQVEKSQIAVDKSPKKKPRLAPQSPTRRSPRKHGEEVIKENQKCMFMDIKGGKRVVAKGRVHSTDPRKMVHCVPLGPNAASVWVDVVKVDDAVVWRQSDEMTIIKDAHGSPVAWPLDKLVFY